LTELKSQTHWGRYTLGGGGRGGGAQLPSRVLTMNIQVEPGTILLGWWPIEEHHFTFVPSLVRLTDVGQVERSETIGGVRWNSGHTSLVPLTAMCGVCVVPDVYWDLQALQRSSPGPNRSPRMRHVNIQHK
jgi:hypothetical protein